MTYPFAINPFSIPWKISSWRFFSNPDEKNLFWQLPVPTSGSFVCLSIYSYKVIVFRLAMLLSQFSRVRLYATPETAAQQAPPSLGFSRQTLEWVAISFSNAGKWKVKVKSLSRVRPSATAAFQDPQSMGCSRQEYWSGVPLPSPLGLQWFS